MDSKPICVGMIGVIVSIGHVKGQECFQWREVARPVEDWYYPRYESVAFDSFRNMTVVVGGYDGGYLEPNETWGWDGSEWNLLDVGGVPGRSFASGAFDSDRGRMVIFGGRGMDNVAHGPLQGDTWEWDGTEWSLRAETGPLPRQGHCMAYDSARKVTLMFGGDGEYGLLGSLWAWDGVSWTLLSGEGPRARTFPACAFDTRRSVFVINGGFDDDGQYVTYLGDTWEWNGESWRIAVNPTHSGTAYGAMTFDENRRVTVHYGGTGEGFISGYTSEWDGIEWKAVPVADRPNLAHAMTYDSARKRVIVVGGIRNFQKLFEMIRIDEAADTDFDCDADLFDFAAMQACAGAVMVGFGCEQFDGDKNGSIDPGDLAEWAYSYSGPAD